MYTHTHTHTYIYIGNLPTNQGGRHRASAGCGYEHPQPCSADAGQGLPRARRLHQSAAGHQDPFLQQRTTTTTAAAISFLTHPHTHTHKRSFGNSTWNSHRAKEERRKKEERRTNNYNNPRKILDSTYTFINTEYLHSYININNNNNNLNQNSRNEWELLFQKKKKKKMMMMFKKRHSQCTAQCGTCAFQLELELLHLVTWFKVNISLHSISLLLSSSLLLPSMLLRERREWERWEMRDERWCCTPPSRVPAIAGAQGIACVGHTHTHTHSPNQ